MVATDECLRHTRNHQNNNNKAKTLRGGKFLADFELLEAKRRSILCAQSRKVARWPPNWQPIVVCVCLSYAYPRARTRLPRPTANPCGLAAALNFRAPAFGPTTSRPNGPLEPFASGMNDGGKLVGSRHPHNEQAALVAQEYVLAVVVVGFGVVVVIVVFGSAVWGSYYVAPKSSRAPSPTVAVRKSPRDMSAGRPRASFCLVEFA